MVEHVICPVLVRRDEELASLEDALLSAHRGESRFVVLGGEAGIGKTRLASRLAEQARRLDATVLWGSCSEAELSLPYLPFVEAIGNYLATGDIAAVAERLGPAARRELSQLFPQLSDGEAADQGGDPAHAKLRLFEAVVSLLSSIERTVVLVVEDVHWADESTRELLDHLARRLTGQHALLLVTYRSDELHRGHALLPVVQSWRRSRIAEIVELEPLTADGIAEMISAIFDAEDVAGDFRDFMRDRSEGNPFVLEEMLKEAVERGDIFRTDVGWDRKSLDELGIPPTVRDAILMRFERLEPDDVSVLQAAAVLGRAFDYPMLLAVTELDESTVQGALDEALQQQLLEEQRDAPGRYRWRHALTQEAILGDTVTPRRQQLHGRAADALMLREETKPVELAHHLLEAGRFSEAIPVCIEAAGEAEKAAAFREAASLLERTLPYVGDEAERARLIYRIGLDRWLNGEPAVAEQYLQDGIETLERLGETFEAARARVVLGRCFWERSRPDLALAEFEQARDVLERAGPSPELSTTYMRIAGLRLFELDHEGCIQASRRAIEVAEAAGADSERVWALSFHALGMIGRGEIERGFDVMEACFREAETKGYWLIASNIAYNDVWERVHLMHGGLEERLDRLAALPVVPLSTDARLLANSYVEKVQGKLIRALENAERGIALFEDLRMDKMAWRCMVQRAAVLTELAEIEEAAASLPPTTTRTELQDMVYDAPARIRNSLARGDVELAVSLAQEILAHAKTLAPYRETLALAAEAFVAGDRLDDARVTIDIGRAHPSPTGIAFLDEAEGRLLVAQGHHDRAISHLTKAIDAAGRTGFRIAELRARMLLADATARAGEIENAVPMFRAVGEEAAEIGARLIADEAHGRAKAFGISLPEAEAAEQPAAPEPAAIGERLVTSMFADVRGSTALAVSTGPQELAERMDTLYRFAKAEVKRHNGIVDKFAGDAVMATFNISGARVDHCVDALRAALTLRDKAALTGLPLGIGIAVGAAILAKGASDDNIAVRGTATNLAARLQAAAGGSEILLSEEAHRRVARWLAERGMSADREELTLKGFDRPQVAYRLSPGS